MSSNTAKVDVVLGLQWGDEGKGKIVDVLARKYNIIARFQGGPNAGHSIQSEGRSFVLHSVPSGIFREGTDNIIGGGVVLDPIIFQKECSELEKLGVPVRERIRISKKAHLITPTHRIIDAASEASKGKSKIGSTLKGIGPTYMDKTGRNGLRVGDILASDFQARFEALKRNISLSSGSSTTPTIPTLMSKHGWQLWTTSAHSTSWTENTISTTA